jgi:hypothetical protein
MRNYILACGFAVLCAGAASCVGFDHNTTLSSPSPSGMSALMGSWSSATIAPSPSSCTDFKWTVTEQTSSMARGSFSATCGNDLKVNGTAQGSLSGSTIMWSAAGNATASDLPACPISLSGTAELGTDSIRVPYSGDTCLGKVSGVEVLRRH